MRRTVPARSGPTQPIAPKATTTDAARYDGHELTSVLDASNSSGKVWADTAYRTKSNEAWLKANGFFSHIHRRKPRGKPMPEHIRRGDATRSIIRSCVEHVFGQEKGPMDLSIRTIGIERATTKMTLANLAYNMKPLIFHERRKTMAWLRPKSENHPFRRAKGPENNPNAALLY